MYTVITSSALLSGIPCSFFRSTARSAIPDNEAIQQSQSLLPYDEDEILETSSWSHLSALEYAVLLLAALTSLRVAVDMLHSTEARARLGCYREAGGCHLERGRACDIH